MFSWHIAGSCHKIVTAELVIQKTLGFYWAVLKSNLMQHHHHPNINDTFHSKRTDKGNVMLVLNADNYVMAEYNMRTGETVWQRFVPITQREKVEAWLAQSYPAQPVVKTIATKSRKGSLAGRRKS